MAAGSLSNTGQQHEASNNNNNKKENEKTTKKNKRFNSRIIINVVVSTAINNRWGSEIGISFYIEPVDRANRARAR